MRIESHAKSYKSEKFRNMLKNKVIAGETFVSPAIMFWNIQSLLLPIFVFFLFLHAHLFLDKSVALTSS